MMDEDVCWRRQLTSTDLQPGAATTRKATVDAKDAEESQKGPQVHARARQLENGADEQDLGSGRLQRCMDIKM